VAYKGKVVALAQVNPKSDDVLTRLLHEVTKNSNVFPKPIAKKRKSSSVEVKENTAE